MMENKTKIALKNKSIFITGVAGFIGSNLAKRLLSTVEGVKVVGLDNMNNYYDVRLKEARLKELEQFEKFSFVKGNLADKAVIESIFEQYKPEIVVNLGAQAGVRYSITNPDAYVEANLIGFYNILEACRHSYDEGHTPVEHLVYASSSSVYGLKRERTEQQMRDAIAKGTLMKDLQWVPVKKDDLFFIGAGTIHAIGAGALVAEIQENSNLTYRLYDYDRVGKDGKKRELHIDKALDVANLKSSAEPKQPLRVLKYRQGIASELLTRCKYFEVYRMIVNTERRQKVHYRADEIAFRVLLCVNGCGTISYEGGNLPFYKGDCIFVPADSEVLTIHGQAQFLDVRG